MDMDDKLTLVPKEKKNEKKRIEPESSEDCASSRKMPRQDAASLDFNEGPASLSENSSAFETEKDHDNEAVSLTSGQDRDDHRLSKLTDYLLYNENGIQRPFEVSKIEHLHIYGLILPSDECAEKDKESSVKCKISERLKSWEISGYERGYPVIRISTDVSDYYCDKPESSYTKFYCPFFEKARACIQVFKKLSKSCGGNPDLSLDELLATVSCSMIGSKNFPGGMSIKDFVVSHGEFIYYQLICLDKTSKRSDQIFSELPVLVALRDESRQKMLQSLHIKDNGERLDQFSVARCRTFILKRKRKFILKEIAYMKSARLLQEEEYSQPMKQEKGQQPILAPEKFCEADIANDYPLPAYFKTSDQEEDESGFFDNSLDADDLPQSMLHNWTLYNSDSRLISLELLPMKPCTEFGVTIYGSGFLAFGVGSGFCLDDDPNQTSSCVLGAQDVDGFPICLSAIKEWVIEFRSLMVFISIRTEMARYRLGRPSKQYAPWFEPILKTANLAISIIKLLKEQCHVSQLSFANVIKSVSEFEKNHPAYISYDLAEVERYVVVHGQIILQLFAEYPDEMFRKCAFVIVLSEKVKDRHHTKCLVKKEVLKRNSNFNPRAAMAPVVSRRKAMRATTTRLISRIWCDYYSNFFLGDSKEGSICEVKEGEEVEEEQDECEDAEEFVEVNVLLQQKTLKLPSISKPTTLRSMSNEIKWNGEPIGETSSGEALYKQATVRGDVISVGGAVILEVDGSEEIQAIYFVEYMFEKSYLRKMVHGRLMQVGSHTILGNAVNEREIFLTNECLEFELEDIKQTVVMNILSMPWGHQHRKNHTNEDETYRETVNERKKKGLPAEYYCKSLYQSETGAFFALPYDTMGLGNGICHSCKIKEIQKDKKTIKVDSSKTRFMHKGNEYYICDFVYVIPQHFAEDKEDHGTSRAGRNIGLKAYVVCQLLKIDAPKADKPADPESFQVTVRRFFRPEDISPEKAYSSDIREVFYSEQILNVPIGTIEGKCEVRRNRSLLPLDGPAIIEHVFYCEYSYNPATGSINQLPPKLRLKFSLGKEVSDVASKKQKRKSKEVEKDFDIDELDASQEKRLATLDIFAGCGGLSEGLQQSGVSLTKWAIEYEKPAGEAFMINHRDTWVFLDDCNVILRAIMEKCGDAGDCVSTSEAEELAAKLGEEKIKNLPLPGQVDFIIGGPPCQGFFGMNKFNQTAWDKAQCESILAFLSFADYFRPKFFLLENVWNFISLNKGRTFCLTLASLLEMGYQLRFGILEAGAYGVTQSRKRVFIWAASPEEVLPEWPEPMHVFAGLKSVQSTANGVPFRSITVRDTIGDLPLAIKVPIFEPYLIEPVSWFQKNIRGETKVLFDHISKEMNELDLLRCRLIPTRRGADWHDLQDVTILFRSGQVVDLIPWCLPDTAKANKHWKGLFGRLDWEGNFPMSTADPQPMGKVGMCLHPEWNRIVTIRECARSQGFMDSYQFAGDIHDKYRQIGNAVPPPLAFALGRKLKEALDRKRSI